MKPVKVSFLTENKIFGGHDHDIKEFMGKRSR